MNSLTQLLHRLRSPVVLSSVLGMLASSGCEFNRQATRYQIRIHCTLPDGTPVPGVQIARTGESPQLSDAQGDAFLRLEGREGQEVLFSIAAIPPALTLTEGSESRKIVLKNFGAVGKNRVSEVTHEVHLRPKTETYVVLVSAAQAPLATVAVNGDPLAALNSESASAFRWVGKPGEELKVTILASKDAQTKGSDPTQSFTLPDGGGVLSFHSNLFIKPPPVKRERVRTSGVVISKWGQ